MTQPICTTDEFGTIRYTLNRQLHRIDGPAITYQNMYMAWFQFGLAHRTDGPAYIRNNGIEEWYQNGQRHRSDGPAVIYPDGTEEYWLEGEKVDIMVHFIQRPKS